MPRQAVVGLLFIGFPLLINAQTGIDSIVKLIAKNNKSIQVSKQLSRAKSVSSDSGLTLADPQVEFDYLQGSPSQFGNQTEFLIVQSFDFITAYAKKKQLARAQKQQAEYVHRIFEQEILLEAQKTGLEIIYRNKLQKLLQRQKNNAVERVKHFRRKLDTGEGNLLDLNKMRLQLIDIESERRENEIALANLNEKLTRLNGGGMLILSDTLYAPHPKIPDFETLKTEMEHLNSYSKLWEQKKHITQKQTELARALSLPKFEIGYRYQSVINQELSGIHFGMSLPLWESKNRVKAQRQQFTLAEYEEESGSLKQISELKSLYSRYKNQKEILEETWKILKSINSIDLLDKALEYGEINIIEHLEEANFFYDAQKKHLKREHQYYLTLARLLKFRL